MVGKIQEVRKICQALVLAQIGPSAFIALSFVGEAPQRMSDLAEACSFSTAAATGCVDRLEKLQYVERVHDQEDRRSVKVAITPQGSRILTQILA